MRWLLALLILAGCAEDGPFVEGATAMTAVYDPATRILRVTGRNFPNRDALELVVRCRKDMRDVDTKLTTIQPRPDGGFDWVSGQDAGNAVNCPQEAWVEVRNTRYRFSAPVESP